MKTYIYKDVELEILEGDITKMETEAIVNAAKNTLLGGGGVDGAIHRAGGPEILKQCMKIGGCPTGEARITVGGNLKSNYIIHTVGPVYVDGDNGEEKKLYNAYYNSLFLGKEYNVKTISFPNISTGVYNYPKEEAMKIGIRAIMDFIEKEKNYEKIVFVAFSNEDYNLYNNYLDKIIS